MRDYQINDFSKGMDKDTAYASLQQNSYTHANDVEFVSDIESNQTFAKSKLGTQLRAYVPKTEPLKQIWRVQHYCDTESQEQNPDLLSNSAFVFRPIDIYGNFIATVIVYFDGTTNLTFANFKTTIEAAFLAEGLGVTIDIIGNPLVDKFATITIDSYAGFPKIANITQRTYTISESFDKTVDSILLQDEYSGDIELIPIAYTNIQNIGFIISISADKKFTEIGTVNKQSIVNGLWEYRRHLRTKDFIIDENNPIDITAEKQNDSTYSVYFSDNTNKPKCIYITSLGVDSCLKYNPFQYQEATKGIYNLTNTNEQTNAQLINNIVHCEYKETIESGGNLTTGGKAYAVRCCISDLAKTEWSVISNTIPVIAQNSQSKLAWVSIEGTPIGQPTSKMNVITIKNAKPYIFSYCEVAVIEFTSDKAGTASIIGQYDITNNDFDIIHNGNENYIPIPIEEFINTEPIILTAKNQTIKKQRINYSNVSVGANDDIYAQIAEKAVLDTERFEIQSVGELPSTDGNLRFYATGGNHTYGATEGNTTTEISYTLLPSPTPIISPSPYSGSTYTVTSFDAPNMQLVLTDKINVKASGTNVFYETFAGVYFIVKKNGNIIIEDAIYEAELAYDFNISDPVSYRMDVPLNKTYNITVSAGDTITFSWRLYIGSNTLTVYDNSVLTIRQLTTQSALQFNNTRIGEYQIPYNVANRSGYMMNDFRFVYVRYHLKNGFVTSAYPLGKYSEDGINFVKGLHKTTEMSAQIRFTSSGSGFDRKVYNYAILVNNLDITAIRSQLEGVSFWVSDDIGAVIGTGLYSIATLINGDTYSCDLSGAISPSAINRNYGMFFSHDTVNKDIQSANGDKIRLFGQPSTYVFNNSFKAGLNFTSKIYEYSGYINTGNNPNISILNIEDAKPVQFNSTSDIIYNETLNTAIKLTTSTSKIAALNNQGIAITTTQKMNTSGSGLSNVVQLAQYQRSINILTLSYKNYTPKFTGTLIKIDNSVANVINQLSVYGGDAYTQKTVRKVTYWKTYKVGDNEYIDSSFITYYAQNRVNAQLFFTNKTASEKTYNLSGSKSIYSYLFPFPLISDLVEEQFNYEKSYLAHSPIQDTDVYNNNKTYPSLLENRCYYSDPKPVGSVYDAYRKIRALNFLDLEQKNGPIVGMFPVGERMLFIQPNLVCSVPYATETLLNNSETINIYVGNGSVYGRNAQPISSLGASLKSATLGGYNTNGNIQVYWLSTDFKNICKYDYSGAKILSNQNKMRTFFTNNTRLIRKEFDVNLAFDTNKSDVIITTTAVSDYPRWEINYPYNEGDYVTFVADGYAKNFEKTKAIYRATNSVTSPLNPFLDTENWEFIPFNNTNFYNLWTLVFNETRDYFTTFVTPMQKRYFNHNNSILSPKGISSFGRIYEMNIGDPLQFFEEDGSFKQGVFEIEMIANKGIGLKRFTANSVENGSNNIITATVTNSTDLLETQATEYEKRGVKTIYPIQPTSEYSLQGGWLKTKISSLYNITIRTVTTFWNNVL